MDVHVDVFRAVELDDPVYGREVEPAGGDVGAYEEGVFCGRETLKDVETGRLFLFPVEVEEGETRVEFTECFKDESDLRASARTRDDGRRTRLTCLQLLTKTTPFICK